MSRALRNTLLIAAAMLLLGGILSGIGFALGGMKPVFADSSGLYIADESRDDYIFVDESYEDLTAIEINADAVGIKLVEGDSFSLSGSYHPDFADLDISVENKKLVINSSPKPDEPFEFEGFSFGIGFYHQLQNELTITYPKGTNFDYVALDGKLGALNISSLSANSLAITLDAGAFEGSDIAAESISVHMNLGECTIDGLTTKNSIDFDLNAGSLNIKDADLNMLTAKLNLGSFDLSGNLKGDVEANLSAGSLRFDLDNAENDIDYALNTNLGSISLNGQDHGSSVEKSASQAKCALNLHSDLGSISIDTK